MIRRISLLAAAAAAALTMAMMSTAPAAHADGGAETRNGGAGSAWFTDYGDHLTVNDWAADGHGVRAWIYESSDGTLVRSAYNGKGFEAGPVHKNYNLPENHKYELWVCLVDGQDDEIGFDCGYKTIYS